MIPGVGRYGCWCSRATDDGSLKGNCAEDMSFINQSIK